MEPAFQIINTKNKSNIIKIYPNGKVEGLDDIFEEYATVNRIPIMLAQERISQQRLSPKKNDAAISSSEG